MTEWVVGGWMHVSGCEWVVDGRLHVSWCGEEGSRNILGMDRYESSEHYCSSCLVSFFVLVVAVFLYLSVTS